MSLERELAAKGYGTGRGIRDTWARPVAGKAGSGKSPAQAPVAAKDPKAAMYAKGRMKAGEMNGTEQAYSEHLAQRQQEQRGKPQCGQVHPGHAPVTLRQADAQMTVGGEGIEQGQQAGEQRRQSKLFEPGASCGSAECMEQ